MILKSFELNKINLKTQKFFLLYGENEGFKLQAIKKEFENIKLEFEYLSSAEKLLEFQDLYFDDKLIIKNIKKIKIFNQNLNKPEVEQLTLINER